jgi:hypothetical protein
MESVNPWQASQWVVDTDAAQRAAEAHLATTVVGQIQGHGTLLCFNSTDLSHGCKRPRHAAIITAPREEADES